MQFTKLNDITLHYQLIGAPEGKPIIVFANSLGADFRMWRDVIVQLIGDYSIITYDKRGHGLSDAPPAPYSIDDHVNDLAALLEYLKVKDAIICGLSVGGLIAQGLSLARPDLVKALVLCNTAHKIGDEALWNERIEAVRQEGIASICDAVMARWFSEDYRKSNSAELNGYRNMLGCMPLEGYIGTCAAIRDADFTKQVPTINIPTLCIASSEDVTTPPVRVRELAKLVSGAYFEVIEGAGHLTSIEKPDMLFDIIQAFMQGLE